MNITVVCIARGGMSNFSGGMNSALLELTYWSTAESQQLCLTILIWRKRVSFHQVTSLIQNSKLLSQHLLATSLKMFKITDGIPVIQKGMFLFFVLFWLVSFCSRHAGFSSFTWWQLWYIRSFLFLTAECKSCLLVLGKLCSYTQVSDSRDG